MSSTVYHYANMSDDIKEKFGLILTKETRLKHDKPRMVRLVFDHENLNWQTGQFSLSDCNGVIISKETGFFCTKQNIDINTDHDQNKNAFHGLKNILSLYQCSKSEKLSILHNVFGSLIELIPSNTIHNFNISNSNEPALDINKSMKTLCSEIKLILKIEFLPKSTKDSFEAPTSASNKSSSKSRRIFKDLEGHSVVNEYPYYEKYKAMKRKYDVLQNMAEKQSELYERQIERRDTEIDALKQEITILDENMEILRLALDSQTKIAEQNRLMYSPKSIHEDTNGKYLSIQELKYLDIDDHSSCVDRESSQGGFDEMKSLLNKIEDLNYDEKHIENAHFSFKSPKKENTMHISQEMRMLQKEYNKLDKWQHEKWNEMIRKIDRLKDKFSTINCRIYRLSKYVMNVQRISMMVDYILDNWNDVDYNHINRKVSDNDKPTSLHHLLQYIIKYFTSNIQNIKLMFDGDE